MVGDVHHPIRDTPSGTKGGVNEWCVILAELTGNAAALVAVLQAWLRRNTGTELSIEIDGDCLRLSNPSPESEAALIELWIQRVRNEDD